MANKEMTKESLIYNIRRRNIQLAVLGSGYVGLPTAALFADAGFHVVALDINPNLVEIINNGLSPVSEPGLKRIVSHNVQAGRLKAALSSAKVLRKADIIVISIQTPISRRRKPSLSFFTRALESVGKALQKGTLVVISSTIPPSTMQNVVMPKLESLSGLKADTDFYLAYVPERIAPGNALKEFVESPRLVGGSARNSTKMAAELFRTVCKTVVETDAATAEIAKLAENTFRDVNIAFANQLALICEQHGADVTEVIKLANTHPRVKIHTPGPGVGGPCLPKDPYLLTHETKLKTQDIIKTARKINDHMPRHMMTLTLQALKNTGKDVQTSTIAILGTAYKTDVDDPRNSPSEPIIHKLLSLGANVATYDPYCNESFGAKKANSLHEAVEGADCLAIMTDHKEFKNLDLQEIGALMNRKPAIIDGRRIVNPYEAEKLGFFYCGVGFGRLRNQQ